MVQLGEYTLVVALVGGVVQAATYSNTTTTASAANSPWSIVTATSSKDGSTTESTVGTSITGFPGATGLCCGLYPLGVGVNTWYDKAVTVVTATVHSTFLDRNGSLVLNGTSTEYDSNATSYFGTYPVYQYTNNITNVPGVPNTLLPPGANLYGSSEVGVATEITFPYQNLTITSPTPFLYYPFATLNYGFSSGGSCYQTTEDRTLLISTTVNGTYYSSSNFPTATQTVPFEFNPGGYYGAFRMNLSYAVPYEGNVTEYMETLDYLQPGQIQFGGFPQWPGMAFADDPFISSQFASIGYCTDAGGEGNPTVHIAVSALTTDSTTVIMAGPSTPAPAPATTTTPTAPPQQTTDGEPTTEPSPSLSEETTSPGEASPTPSAAPSPSDETTSPTEASPTPPIAPSPSDGTIIPSEPSPTQGESGETSAQPSLVNPSPSPSSDDPQSDTDPSLTAPAPGQSSVDSDPPAPTTQNTGDSVATAIIGGLGGLTTEDEPSPSPAAPTTAWESQAQTPAAVPAVTVGGSVIPPNSASEYVLPNSQTLAPGGSAVTYEGSTYSLDSSASAIVVDGQSSPLQASPTQQTGLPVITVAGQTVSPNPASKYVVGSQTLQAGGSDAVIDGTTYSIASSGTAIVVNGEATPIAAPVGNAGPSTGALTIGSEAVDYTALGQGAILVGSQIISAGGSAATMAGEQVSLASNGALEIGGSPAATLAPVTDGTAESTGMVRIGSQGLTYSQLSQGNVVIGSQTLSAGGAAATIAGQQVSVASNGAVEVDGSPVATMAPASAAGSATTGVISVGSSGLGFTELSNGAVVIGSQTVSAGGSAVNIAGQQVSVASNGVVEANNSPAATLAPVPAESAPMTGIIDIGGSSLFYTELRNGALVIGSQTVSAGNSAVTIAGQQVSLASNGAVNVNGTPTTTLAPDTLPSTGLITAGSETLSYTFSGGAARIGSQSLAPGSTLVIGSETLTLAPSGSSIETVSGDSSVSRAGQGASAGSPTVSGAAVSTENAGVTAPQQRSLVFAVIVVAVAVVVR